MLKHKYHSIYIDSPKNFLDESIELNTDVTYHIVGNLEGVKFGELLNFW